MNKTPPARLTTGVYVIHVKTETIDKLYELGSLSIEELTSGMVSSEACQELGLPKVSNDWVSFPHANLVIKSIFDPRSSALVKVNSDCKTVSILRDYSKNSVYGLSARNKEQNMLLNSLMDDDISCVVVEGKAGSGKTICALAAALELLQNRSTPYEKLILTRPMSTVGSSMGALPGDSKEKFIPYLGNYFSNLEYLLSSNGLSWIEMMIDKGKIELAPIKLIGGMSWHNSIVLADEIQSLTPEQMYALGTRVSENSKLVLMGDLVQRYGRNTDVTETGLWQFTNSVIPHQSPYVSYIKLLKQERHPLADVFYQVFYADKEVD